MTHIHRRRLHNRGLTDIFGGGSSTDAGSSATQPDNTTPTATPPPKDTSTPKPTDTNTKGNNGNNTGNNGNNGNNGSNNSSTTGKTDTNTSSSSSTDSSSSETSSSSNTSATNTASTTKSTAGTSNTDTNTSKSGTTPLTTPTQNTSHTTGTIGSAPNSSATAPSTEQNGATTSTGTLVAAIGGAIVGIAILSFLIAFFVRRWRRRRDEDEAGAFDPAQFRRSAVVLDDSYNANDESPFAPNPPMSARNGSGAPRPPTMIERHMAHTPNITAATYSPTGYNYGAGQQDTFDFQQSWTPGEVIPSPISPAPDHDPTSPSPFLNRQPSPTQQYAEQYHVQYPNPHDEAQYVNVDRASPTPRAATGKGAEHRPDTVYDLEDAYGGM